MAPLAAPDKERDEMWQNFFHACKLGTVVQAYDTIVWQKVSKFAWKMVGSASDYSADSIAWPADVLLDGIE